MKRPERYNLNANRSKVYRKRYARDDTRIRQENKRWERRQQAKKDKFRYYQKVSTGKAKDGSFHKIYRDLITYVGRRCYPKCFPLGYRKVLIGQNLPAQIDFSKLCPDCFNLEDRMKFAIDQSVK
jgi:hypothetical protein